MPIFYEVNSVASSCREHWWGCKGNPLSFLIVMVAKVIRARTPTASDDANVDSTFPLIVDSLPPDLMKHFEPMAAELASLGFSNPVYHEMNDLGSGIRIYWATYHHSSGQSCARIHNRYWDRAAKRERALFPILFTFFGDGSFLVSSSGRPDTAEPPTVEMNRMPKAALPELWHAHLRLLDKCCEKKSITHLNDKNLVICASEHLHRRQRDFHLKRGFFKNRSTQEAEQAQQVTTTAEQVRAEGSAYPEIIAEIVQLEEKKPRWSKGMWILGGSFLIFFLTARLAGWQWGTTLWLIPILLFHESGHWVAMRAFGYRNMRMFFIPLFGAAVSGKHRNVAGWKKAIVSLAGPVPGIIMGTGLAVVGMMTHWAGLRQATFLLVFINVFNLLPFLPLDGGHFLQATLFCRNRWLDTIFRCAAIVALVLLTVFGISKTLMYIGIAFAIGLPVAFKSAKIVDQFRCNPLPPPPAGDDRIPRQAAESLIAAVKKEMPKTGNRIVAQTVLNIYETLNAHPPGIAATIGLLALYGGAIVASVVCSVLLLFGSLGGLGTLSRLALGGAVPKHKVGMASTESWRGAKVADESPSSKIRLVTTFKTGAEAKSEFAETVSKLPETATGLLFGDSIIIGLPRKEAALEKQWRGQFHSRSTNTFLITNNTLSLALAFDVPTPLGSTNVEDALNDYFASVATNLIPPWDPIASSPGFARHLEARRVWSKLGTEYARTWTDPTVEAANQRLEKIQADEKHINTNELAAAMEEQRKVVHRSQEETSRRLDAQYAGTPYATLVDLNFQFQQGEMTNETKRADVMAKVASELGCVGPGTNITQDGNVFRRRLHFQIPMAISDPETSLPQLMNWLTKQGCTNFRYEFQAFDASNDDGDN